MDGMDGLSCSRSVDVNKGRAHRETGEQGDEERHRSLGFIWKQMKERRGAECEMDKINMPPHLMVK